MSGIKILLILTFFTGIIDLLDWCVWSKKRSLKQKPGPLIDYSRTFFPVFLVIILINQYSLALALLIVSVVTGMV